MSDATQPSLFPEADLSIEAAHSRHPSHIIDNGVIVPVEPADGPVEAYSNPGGYGDGTVPISERQDFRGASDVDRAVARDGIEASREASRRLRVVGGTAVKGS